MPTVDDLKVLRDGTLFYGVKRQPWSGWMWPVVTAIGRDASGHVVAVDKMWSPASGTITYGDPVAAVTWDTTEEGRTIMDYRRAVARENGERHKEASE